MYFRSLYKFVTVVCWLLFSSMSLANSTTKINVGIDIWPGYYPVIIADKLGYFEQQQLSVTTLTPENTDDMQKSFTEGKLDVICVALGDAFALYAQDPDLRVVLISDESAGGDALLASPSFKLDKNTIIGTNLSGFGELFIAEYLKSQNFNPDDVVLIQQEAADAATFLSQKRADIVHTWEPYVTEAMSFREARVIFDSSKTPGLIPDAVLVRGGYLKENPQAIKRFVASWLKAATWWQKNRRQGDHIIETELYMMPGTVNLEGVKLYTLAENKIAFEKNNSMKSLYYVTQKYIDFFVSKGQIKRIKPEQIIDPSFIPD